MIQAALVAATDSAAGASDDGSVLVPRGCLVASHRRRKARPIALGCSVQRLLTAKTNAVDEAAAVSAALVVYFIVHLRSLPVFPWPPRNPQYITRTVPGPRVVADDPYWYTSGQSNLNTAAYTEWPHAIALHGT